MQNSFHLHDCIAVHVGTTIGLVVYVIRMLCMQMVQYCVSVTMTCFIIVWNFKSNGTNEVFQVLEVMVPKMSELTLATPVECTTLQKQNYHFKLKKLMLSLN